MLHSFSSKQQDIPAISQAKKKSEIPTISQSAPKSKGRNKFGLRKSKSVRADKATSWARKRKFLLRQGSDPPPVRPGRVVREDSREEEEEADTRQFLKVDVKYITDGEVCYLLLQKLFGCVYDVLFLQCCYVRDHFCMVRNQGCHQLNLIAGKVNGEMALN